MSRTNETKHIKWHETCKCKCGLDGSVCNNKQRWNHDKCKELIDKGVCNKGFIWNLSDFQCECDKSCDVGEYLDYENCKCRKKLVDKLVEECTETVEEVKLAKITLSEDENKHKCSSCTLYIVLFSIIFTIDVGIGTCFAYKYMNHWYLKKKMLLVLSLVPVLKQQFSRFSFIEVINGRNQTNSDQKSNLLFLQRHYQSRKF